MLELYKKEYWDYGPTLFTEVLIKYYNISISNETARKWLRNESITTSIRKKKPHRKKRERRSCFGELLQFDGSYHDWFEGRRAECCLLNCVDDATERVYLKTHRIYYKHYGNILINMEYRQAGTGASGMKVNVLLV